MARLSPASILIDGAHWPPTFSQEMIKSAKSLKPRADDIFVCTFPRSGTTWIQHIVHQLLGKDKYEVTYDEAVIGKEGKMKGCNHESGDLEALHSISPMLENVGAGFYDGIESPRIIKSHFSFVDIPKGGGAKYIYACRNLKDCATSLFHHRRNMKPFNFKDGYFDEFFGLFMEGTITYCDYFDHLMSWLEAIEKGEEYILLVRYEDMIADLRSAVVRIAKFLGGKAAEVISDEKQLAKIVDASTFSSMILNQQRWFPLENLHNGALVRKGGSRNWKEHFSLEQSERMDKRFHERCSGTAASEWWKPEMAWDEDRERDESDLRNLSAIFYKDNQTVIH